MRLTFVVLAVIAVTTSFASTNAQPTAISAQMSTRMANSSDASLDNEKRFLRGGRVSEDDISSEDIHDDNEERGISITTDELAKLVRGETSKIFARWRKAGHANSAVTNALEQLHSSGKVSEEKYRDIVRWYRDLSRR
ncbi:RxLR effector protein [Phytophthora megakarya]|uniref:RxLR effector protein n=1 Tax=Phytophthora megakarya TaxID=4795 RepID=A0A225V153_9STRA|nr:RxLR effector protein [Phytophthora megakarya]